MNVSRIAVEHVRVVADKPIDKVAKAFEQQMGQFDPEVYKLLTAGENPDKVRVKLEAMVGPSGFMLFRTSDHGALLRLVGQKKKAIQYLVGNPLFAVQMTQSADILITDVRALLPVIARRAQEHKLTPCIGRSHGIHGEPTTFGLKMALMHDEFSRALERPSTFLNEPQPHDVL
jgi:hypothetical protein